ncbi:MAG: O-antigen ligase [Coleofasciculus sp. B1-GNL1-01]|uniref:O-antigen ligase family protein n=1 Tax=Coleofasciculus sp. B1-GNL1-01 TaxID=3068484 RepID=UPI0032F9569D
MKQLILHPLVFTLLFLASIVYFIVSYQLISHNLKWAKTIEKFFIISSMLIISGMSINFTGRFHPSAFYVPGQRLPYILMTLSFYAPFLVLLLPRFRYTLSSYIAVLISLLKANPFFCIFLLLRLIASILSATPEHTFKATIVLLIVTACFIYVGKQYSMKGVFDLLLWHHIIALSLSLFFGREANWKGIYIHKNIFGFTMDLAAILLYLQSIRVPRYKTLFLTLSALAVFCSLQSNSGMAKVLLVILIFLLVFLRFIRQLPPRLAFASMGIFLAIGISLVILISENAEYLIVEKLDKDMTLTGRTYIWREVIKAVNKHPLFGYGYEGFWQFWRGIDNPALMLRLPEFDGFMPEESHNGYLEIALEVGWIGLAIFIVSLLISIYYGVLHLTRSQDPESVLPLLIFTYIIMTNVTESGVNYISMPWILYVFMATRLSLNTLDNTSSNFNIQKPIVRKSTSPFTRTSTRE